MAVYMISDTHFGHKNILKWRPEWDDIEEHDNDIVENILSVCGKRDSLYILGDEVLSKEGWRSLVEVSKRVEHLHIALGNHSCERKGGPSVGDLLGICKSVFGMKAYKDAWLTHAPLHPNELRGKISVHGHVHSATIDGPRWVNVSCENTGYFPVNFVDIQKGWRGI